MILISKYFHIFRPLVTGLSPRRSRLFQTIQCEIYSGQSGTGPDFSSSTYTFACQYNSTIAHTHFHLNSALYRWTIKEILGTFKISNTPPDITVALSNMFLIFRPQRAK